MKSSRSFLHLTITSKLVIVNCVASIVFAALLAVMLIAFSNIRLLVSDSISQNFNHIQKNNLIGRDILEVYSRTSLLTSRFFKNPDLLAHDRSIIRGNMENMRSLSTDNKLIRVLKDYETVLDAFMAQCAAINSLNEQIVQAEARLLQSLDGLSGLISERLLSGLVDGKNTDYYEQLSALMPTYREEILRAALMISHLHPVTSDIRTAEAVFVKLDAIKDRFKTLQESNAEIIRHGQILMRDVDAYRNLTVSFNNAFIDFRANLVVLEKAKSNIQGVISGLDRDVETAIGQMHARSYRVMGGAIRTAILISIVMILIFAFTTLFFFLRTIRRPIKTICAGIERIREGHLDTVIQIGRHDEWGIIETALNRMIAQLRHSVAELESEIRLRKETEIALQGERDRMELIMETSPLGILVTDSEGRFVFANSQMASLLNRPRSEILSMTIDTAPWRYADMSNNTLQRELLPHRMVVSTGQPLKDFRLTIHTETGERRLLSVHAGAMQSRSGGVTGVVEIYEDIAEKAAAESEREALQIQLRQAHKMEAVGTLAGGIAHDFNNILMGIQGRTSLILLDVPPDHPHHRHLKCIEGHVQDAANLTKQILGFARGGKYEVRPVNLNDVIRNTLQMFGRTRKEITIHTAYDAGLWIVQGDMAQIHQVLLNIFVNASQAMPGGGDLFVATTNVTLDKQYVKPFLVNPGPYVKIAITDTGIGMDEKTKWRVFEPFFTTKEKGIDKGAGLGLASAYGIIKNHDGFINVYSEKGHGTTFTIYLPATETRTDLRDAGRNVMIRGQGLILLVDDEAMILDVGAEMIRHLGYQVLTAPDGESAIQQFASHQGQVDLIILDMIMPGMDGGAAFDRLRALDPSIKIILASGYSMNGKATEIMNRGCTGFIQKPFNMEELSHKLHDILTSP